MQLIESTQYFTNYVYEFVCEYLPYYLNGHIFIIQAHALE